ncbi:MAG: O-antigen ligase family protein [Pseudomonadota bacterium]
MNWSSGLRRSAVPVYLFACLLLGGASAGGLIANLLLQLLALVLIGWALIARPQGRIDAAPRSLAVLALALLGVMVLQLVPLPPGIWTRLPGRMPTTDGFRMLGQGAPWLPLSLEPRGALASLFWLLPAATALIAMIRLGAFRATWITVSILLAVSLGVPIGALQIVGGDQSDWYFYTITNRGQAVGFFANSNHAATLLVAAIPFLAALQRSLTDQRRSPRRASALTVITIATFLVIAVGLVINFSLAGLGLAVPVSIASFVLMKATQRRWLWLGALATGVFAVAAIAAIVMGPVRNNLTERLTGPVTGLDQLSRQVSIAKTLDAAADFAPFGSGVGSFQAIYRTREVPSEVISTYMNHAHSDVAEILLETGAIGAILMVLLVVWWSRRARALWQAEVPNYFARAATIASGAIMVHSFVDYPLRTAAISTLFAVCLALMAEARPFTSRSRSESGARHLAV